MIARTRNATPWLLAVALSIATSCATGAELLVGPVTCGSQQPAETKPITCKMGDRVQARVDPAALDAWLDDASGRSLDNLVLALDGELLVGRPARYDGKHLIFRLRRALGDEANVRAWKAVLARARLTAANDMELSIARVGSLDRIAPTSIRLELASELRVLSAAVLYAVLIVVFVVFALKSNIIRDTSSLRRDGKAPFSLARTQMAWWFFVVLGGFIYIWLVTGDYNTLTPSVLGLIGISAATGLAAIAIDKSNQDGAENAISDLKSETAELSARLKELDEQLRQTPAPANAQELQLERERKRLRLGEIAREQRLRSHARVPVPHLTFASDLLQGAQGISFHRFQMVAWTLVFGGIFGYSVFNSLYMPELDPTLLGLMGVSSGTYVGFKFPAAASA